MSLVLEIADDALVVKATTPAVLSAIPIIAMSIVVPLATRGLSKARCNRSTV